MADVAEKERIACHCSRLDRAVRQRVPGSAYIRLHFCREQSWRGKRSESEVLQAVEFHWIGTGQAEDFNLSMLPGVGFCGIDMNGRNFAAETLRIVGLCCVLSHRQRMKRKSDFANVPLGFILFHCALMAISGAERPQPPMPLGTGSLIAAETPRPRRTRHEPIKLRLRRFGNMYLCTLYWAICQAQKLGQAADFLNLPAVV